MARRKRKRSARKFTIPLAPVIGLSVGMVRPVETLLAGNLGGAIHHASQAYLGYDTVKRTFDPRSMASGLLPLAIGLLVHKFIGGAPLNANRMLAQAGVPVIRI